MSFDAYMYAFLLGIRLRMKLLSHRVWLCSALADIGKQCPKVIPPIYEYSYCSMFSSAVSIVSLYISVFCHFILNLQQLKMSNAFYSLLTGLFLCKVPIKSFAHFFLLSFTFLSVCWNYMLDTNSLSGIYCKYFYSVTCLFKMMSFDEQKFLFLM